MKRKELKRILGLVATATMITGCGTEAQMQQTADTTIEVKAEETAQVSEEAPAEETAPIPKAIYTISFENSNNTSIEVKDGEEAEIPEYQEKKLTDLIDFSVIIVDDEGYYCVGDNRICSSDNVEVDDKSKTIVLRNVNIPYAVRYIVNTEDDTVYPVQLVENDEARNSGICIVVSYEDDENGVRTLTFKGITDMIARAIDDAEVYRGEFKGWAKDRTATEAEYNVGSMISVEENMTIYPIFDMDDIEVPAVAEGSVYKTITNDTRDIVATAKWGNISVNDKNRVVTDQASSTVDQESGKVYMKESGSKNQKSTSSQTGNQAVVGNMGQNIDPDCGYDGWAGDNVCWSHDYANSCDFFDPYDLHFE